MTPLTLTSFRPRADGFFTLLKSFAMMMRSWIRRLFDRHLPSLPVNRTIRKVPCRSRLTLAGAGRPLRSFDDRR